MKGNGLNSMDFSTCLESAVPNNSSIFVDILIDRILPYFVPGILHGGVPPYILHITNRRYDEFQNGKIETRKRQKAKNNLSKMCLHYEGMAAF